MNLQIARTLSGNFLRRSYKCLVTRNISQCTEIQSQNILRCKNIIVPKNGSHLFYSSNPTKCWQCDYPFKSELFCSKCRALQKFPKDVDYFDILGIEKNFDISIDDLKKKYKKLQNLLHPDRFGNKSDEEKDISENISSLINKAYNTLLHPLNRGVYMMKLHNMTISEETENLEQDFLMEIMEKNEEIEEASQDKEKILEMIHENRVVLDSLTKEISKAFHQKDIDQAKKYLIRMKYYISIDDRLKKLKQDLGIVE